MRMIKRLLKWTVALVLLFVFTAAVAYFMLYDSPEDFRTDLKAAKRRAVVELFDMGYIKELSQEEVRYVYQKNCFRQCHGEAAMITAVLSPAGWTQVVERMRVKEGVSISGRMADVIIKHLDEKYPTVKSRYSYETRKKVHHAVWRNDMGQGDIYTDVIYATPLYFKSIGADHLIKEYDLENYHVFIISFSVHEGEIEPENLDEKVFMRSANGEFSSSPPWILRFQTADKHHYEGVVRFARNRVPPILDAGSGWFELVIKGVGGPDDRVLRWEYPIKYPPEVIEEMERVS